MNERTPGDWKKVEGVGQYLWEIHATSPRGKSLPIARVGGGQRYREGNAEFIVRACNAHDDLVAALEAMVKTWDAYLTRPTGYPAYNKAVAALAKAKG